MVQLVWSLVLALHAMGGLLWWWLMPGDYPSSATEFWVNSVLPFVPLVLLVVALLSRGRATTTVLPAVLATFPAFWMAFGIALRLAFVQSSGAAWYLPFFGGFGLALLWARQYRFRVSIVWLVLLVAPSVWAGAVLPGTQRAPDPTTRPANAALFDVSGAPSSGMVKLSKDAQLHPDEGRVVVRRGPVIVTVSPMLGFSDRSPDRCWTSQAPLDAVGRTTRKLMNLAKESGRYSMAYRDEDRSVLMTSAKEGAVELDARCRLAEPVYSHANTWADVTVRGHKKLSVVFSPIPKLRVEPPPATAPVRFAFLDAEGVFHVMQSDKLQLPPYTELGSGKLGPGQPLEVSLYDGDALIAKLSLADFATQASTAMSPTAGAGVAQNSIELVRGGDAENAAALISFSLAATTIGRGTRTVGHAAGVYQNRMTLSLPRPTP